MADQQPTEEQVKQANEAEHAKWDSDFDEESLVVKYKNDDDEKKPDEEEEDTDEADTNEVVEEYYEPEPIVKTVDPGEYVPKDYSFDIVIEGKTTKITTPEQATNFADDQAENMSAPQLLDFMRKANKMETNLERDKEKWELDTDDYESQVSAEQDRLDNINNLANEMQYLIQKGFLPDISDEHKKADWTDPLVAKQPGVKEQIELVNYMKKENDARAKVGVKPFTSMLDVYNSMQVDNARKDNDKKHEESDEARKNVGKKVSAVTSGDGNINAPKGIAVGNPNILRRSASIWDN